MVGLVGPGVGVAMDTGLGDCPPGGKGVAVREATKAAYQAATTPGEKMMIAQYVDDGWDQYWSYPDRPPRLRDRYAPLSSWATRFYRWLIEKAHHEL